MEKNPKPYNKLLLTMFFGVFACNSFVSAYIASPDASGFLDVGKFYSSPQIDKLLDRYPDGFVPLPLKPEDDFLANNYSETGGYIIEYADEPVLYDPKSLLSSDASKSDLKAQTKEITGKRIALQEAHASLRSQIKSMGLSGYIKREYGRLFNGVSVWSMSDEDIIMISQLEDVKKIYPVKKVSISISESVPMIGAPDVWEQKDPLGNSLTGKGIKIAIIDTGIDYTHPDLGGCMMGNIEGDTIGISGNNYSLESDHTYASNSNITWNITMPGYERISIHFDSIRLEDGFDILTIRNSTGRTLQELTGSFDDVWTLSAAGDTLFITLTSDKDVEDWGFSVDMVLNGSADLSAAGCTKVVGGYDFVSNDNNPMDDHSHGTHCASIAAGNGVLKGVAPDAELLAYKVLDSDGSGYEDDVIAGMERAVADGADVISMSLGGSGNPWDAESLAVDNAVKSGTLVVVAAANSGPQNRTISAPGCAVKALTVGAVYKTDDPKRSRLSNVSLISPAGIQINATAFDYSALTSSAGITGELVYAGIGETADFARTDVSGKIVLLKSMTGRIFFDDQIRNSYNAGASAVIIYNNEDYDDGYVSWELLNFSSVPAVGIGTYTGEYLKSLINNGTVNIRFQVGMDPSQVVYFSSRGPAYMYNKPDILAPGVRICAASLIQIPAEYYSTYACVDNKHRLMSGTSMATPHVAGASALLRQKNPSWSPLEIKAALEYTSDDLGYDANTQGAGLIDIPAAADLISAPPVAYLTNVSYMNITAYEEVCVEGLVNITGFAVGENLESYSLEYMYLEGAGNWVSFADETIASDDSLEDESVLAVWDTSNLINGPYVIRLRVTDSDGSVGSDLIYVSIGLEELNKSALCPVWSCDGLQLGENGVDISLSQEQYKSRMECLINCTCPSGSYATVYSSGSLENYYDNLIVSSSSDSSGFSLTGRWTVNDTLKGLVPLNSNKAWFKFTSDSSMDGSNGYTGFNVGQIVCQPYCNSYARYSNWEYIAKIRLADAHIQSANRSYVDGTGSVFATMRAGSNYTLEVAIRTNNLEVRNETVVAWIDLDRDRSYNNNPSSPERIDLGWVNMSSGVYNFQKEFTVPGDLRIGTTRMRISLEGSDIVSECNYSEDLCETLENETALSPCSKVTYGSVQDYTIDIMKSDCGLLGDKDPCGEASLQEILDTLNLWQQAKASLRDVIELINLWSKSAG